MLLALQDYPGVTQIRTPYNAIQYGTMQCNAKQCNAVQGNAM